MLSSSVSTNQNRQGVVRILSCLERMTDNLILRAPLIYDQCFSFNLELKPFFKDSIIDIPEFKNEGILTAYDCYCVYSFNHPENERGCLFSNYMSVAEIQKVKEISIDLENTKDTLWTGLMVFNKKDNELKIILDGVTINFFIPDHADFLESGLGWLSSLKMASDESCDIHEFQIILNKIIDHLRTLISKPIDDYLMRQTTEKYFNEILASVLQLVSCHNDLKSNWIIIWDIFAILKKKLQLCARELIEKRGYITTPDVKVEKINVNGIPEDWWKEPIRLRKNKFEWLAGVFDKIQNSILVFSRYEEGSRIPKKHLLSRSSWIELEKLYPKDKIMLKILYEIGQSMGLVDIQNPTGVSLLSGNGFQRIFYGIQNLLLNRAV